MNKLSEQINQVKKCIEDIQDSKLKVVVPMNMEYTLAESPAQAIEELYENGVVSGEKVADLETLKDFDGTILFVLSDRVNYGQLSQVLDDKNLDDKKVCIVTDITNSGNTDIVMRLLAGDGCSREGYGFYTPRYIDDELSKKGYILEKSCDIKNSDVDEEYSYLINENSLVSQYVKEVKVTLDESGDISRIIRLYSLDGSAKKDQDSVSKCFLSIVMRTQGKRKIELEEALLSVYGQSDDDYEILLMGHNLDETGKANVDEIIAATPQELREKIRYIDVVGGTRTTPLIRGFEEARGEYVSILDDDDIVFDNWIEEFHKLAKENHGKILHAYCARQDWIRIDNPYGGDGLRAIDTFEKLYCRDFNPIHQLSTNVCPIHSLAFPTSAYRNLGMRFDESLNVVEDWDFLMRTSFLTGVANAQEMTSIYRIWRNTVNSAALHSQQEWDQTRRKIIDKFDNTMILMSEGVASELVNMVENRGSEGGYSQREHTKLWTFFVDLAEQKGFSPECMEHGYVTTVEDGRFKVFYDELDKFGSVRTIRLDPSEDAGITLEDIRIIIKYVDGTKREVAPSEISSNGMEFEGKLIFAMPDPQIIVCDSENKDIVGVEISGYIHYELDDASKNYVGALFKQYKEASEEVGIVKKIGKRLLGGKR